MKPLHALLLLLTLGPSVGGTSLRAAEDADTNAETAASDAAEAPTTEDGEPVDIDAALAEEIRTAEAAQAAAPSGSSQETFVPTVQISEDLSVSFPVDI